MYEQFFSICCNITRICANYLNMTYGEFNIFVFCHIQPFILWIGFIITGISIFWKKRIFSKLITIIYSIIGFYFGLIAIQNGKMYYPVCNESFYKAVDQLYIYADWFNCSYITINYLLFIVLFIVILIFDYIIIKIK